MKLKLVIVDFEVSSRAKKWALQLGIPAAVLLGVVGIAYAGNLVTWTSGQTLQASDLNNNFALLQTEIGTPSGFQARMTSANSLNVTSTTQTVVFDTVEFDLNNEYDSTTGVFTAKNAGTYMVWCNLISAPYTVTNTNNGQSFDVAMQQNGTTTADHQELYPVGYGGNESTFGTSAMNLAAGDKVTCTTSANQGVSLDPSAEPHGNVFYAVRVN